MFTLRWAAGSGGIHEAACADNKSAWEIYWALKKSVEKSRSLFDYWIEIFSNGTRLNPEKGSALPPCQEGEGPVFILKKGEN